MSVLDGDVLEAAQEVVIVQAVQVLAHLALQKQTGKEHKGKGFAESQSSNLKFLFLGHLYPSQARGVIADHGGVW